MCGLIAISGSVNSAYEVFFGLMNLQHRGQDGAGILSIEENGEQSFNIQKGSGLVSNIFSEHSLRNVNSKAALGHTRYSTVGQNDPNLLQPFLDYETGIGIAHNGNIVNYYSLLDTHQLNSLTKIESDSALILALMTNHLSNKEINRDNIFSAIKECTTKLIGSYSVLGISKEGDIFGFRDPNGIRPLVLGKRQDKHGEVVYGMASETIALSFLGFNDLEDVKPGEAIYIDSKGQLARKIIHQESFSPCMFEWVYFSRVESKWENQCVYAARFKLGKILADQLKANGISADLIIPIPETSRVAAIALAEVLDKPFRELLIKNRYINRTFILDNQTNRQEAIRRKLFPIGDEIRGKDCLLVDDSIVRGNTAAQIVKLLRQSGAGKITIVSTCPPIVSPCYYGIDFPSPSELISYNRTPQQVAEETGADAVIFQSLDGLKKAIGKDTLCLGCLTGEYPTDITSASDFESKRLEDRAISTQVKNKC